MRLRRGDGRHLGWTILRPYSGGSSLEANFSAPHGGMTIDFAFMNKVLEIHAAVCADHAADHGGWAWVNGEEHACFLDLLVQIHPDDMDVVVQPSIQWMDLNEQIKETGMFFPVDPGLPPCGAEKLASRLDPPE
jgi:D-lactate dehydrogenase (cytochrome)